MPVDRSPLWSATACHTRTTSVTYSYREGRVCPFQGGGMADGTQGSDQVVGSGLAFQSLFFVGALLFLMTLGLNMLANRVVRRVRNKY